MHGGKVLLHTGSKKKKCNPTERVETFHHLLLTVMILENEDLPVQI